ncbi:MAG: BamA/TamA family outer membrane protein [Gemmatimonadota bacterium]
MAVVSILVFPPVAVSQEAGGEHEGTQDVRIAVADSIRADFDRPPARPATDWVDVVEFPLKVVAFPLNVLLVKLPGWVAGEVLAERRPSGIVRLYRSVENWGVRPVIRSSIGPRSAVAIEGQLFRYEPWYAHAAISRRGSQRYRAGVLLAGPRTSFTAQARWQRDAQNVFYGIGPDTDPSRGLYSRDYWDVRGRGTATVARRLTIDAGVGYEDNSIGDPFWTEDESIYDEFDTTDLYGAEEPTRYIRFDGGTTLDLTRRRDFQDTGAWFRLQGAVFRGLSGTDSDFHTITGIAKGYLPFNQRQQLAFRAMTRFARTDGGAGIPFFHLSTLGGTRSALGYSTSRFTDNDVVSLVAEWRYEVWRDIHDIARSEFFLYFGEGAVNERLQDVSGSDWKTSFGVGTRMVLKQHLLGVAFLGFSSEGVQVGIRGTWPL